MFQVWPKSRVDLENVFASLSAFEPDFQPASLVLLFPDVLGLPKSLDSAMSGLQELKIEYLKGIRWRKVC